MADEQAAPRFSLTFWKSFLLFMLVFGITMPTVVTLVVMFGDYARLGAVLVLTPLGFWVFKKYPLNDSGIRGLVLAAIVSGLICLAAFLELAWQALGQMPR